MLKGLGCFRYARHGFCVVTLCRGRTHDRDFYAFVAIEPQNYGFFKRRYQDGEAPNFHAYGIELLRGWGKEPPPEVTEHIRVKHGVEFGISDSFLNRLIDNATALISIPAGPAPRAAAVLQ